MSASVTQRPAAFCPVNNPVIYKFAVTGGPFTLYRIVVGLYRFSDDSLIGEMSKSPDLDDNVTADVSMLLKAILYRDWDESTTSEDEIGSIAFYIKYQEFYTGSATSPTDDVAEPRVTVLASLQIGSNADLDPYVPEDDTKKFLTKFDTPSLWRGYPFTISFIAPTDLPYLVFYYKEYDSSDNILSGGFAVVNGNNILSRHQVEPTHDETKKILVTLSNGPSLGAGFVVTLAPSTWSDGANAFGSKTATKFIKNGALSGVTYSAYLPAIVSSGSTPISIAALISWTKAIAVAATLDVYIRFSDSYGGSQVGISHAGTYSSNISNLPVVFSFTPLSGSSGVMEVLFVLSGATNGDVSIEIQPNQLVFADETYDVSETKEIQVKEPCENPVYLFWKNTLCGDSFWMFGINQDYSLDTDDERKAEQLTCFAEQLSVNEFNAINEVNTPGQVFKPVIQELTTSVNKTSARTDQQLYVIDEDGDKTGVINITQRNSTQTKQVKHSLSVTIEYPELFL